MSFIWHLRPPLRAILLAALGLLLPGCHRYAGSAPIFIPHPDDASKRVEYFVEKPEGHGPWPTVILLHGHQADRRPGGRAFVDWGVLSRYATRGYLAVAVSQPGYGGSTGPADYCGPLTQQAVSGVIARLVADGLASPDKVVIEGISRGAVVAGLLAARDTSLAGVVLISGVYDFPAYVSRATSGTERAGVVRSILSEAGGTRGALRSRSLLYETATVRAPLLLLSGAEDDRTDPEQALQVAAEITRGGGKARAILYEGYGHAIPPEVRRRDVDAFIDSVLARGSE